MDSYRDSNIYYKRQNRIIKIDATPTVATPTEPLTLAEVKDWLIISHSQHDGLLTRLIKAVRLACENRTKQHFVPTNISVTASIYRPFALPRLPLTQFVAVQRRAEENVYQIVDPTGYYLDNLKNLLTIKGYGDYRISYQAGYGPENPLPEDIKLAVLSEVAYRFTNRGDNQSAIKKGLSLTAEQYLTPYINTNYL